MGRSAIASRLALLLPAESGGKPLGSVTKTALNVEMTVDVVAVWDHLRAQSAGLGAFKFDLMIGVKRCDDGSEVLTRPRKQMTKPMDRDRGASFTEALLIGRQELPAEDSRLDESGELLLVVKPATQGLSHGGVA